VPLIYKAIKLFEQQSFQYSILLPDFQQIVQHFHWFFKNDIMIYKTTNGFDGFEHFRRGLQKGDGRIVDKLGNVELG
jgi:hypothetical protein